MYAFVGTVAALGFNRAHGWIAFAIGVVGFATVCLVAEALHRRDARRSKTEQSYPPEPAASP